MLAHQAIDGCPSGARRAKARSAIWAYACLSVFASVLGCGGGPETCTVTGAVTFNGQPVPEGSILFVPEDGKGVPDPGTIRDGRYTARVKPGPKRVEIRATRETGKVDPIMGAAPRESYIPACYNTETILQAEVTKGGENAFDYPLTDPPPTP